MTAPRPLTLAVACTDKGQHPWTALGDLVLDGRLLRANKGYVYGPLAESRKDECVTVDERGRARLWCPRCRRDVPLRLDTARRLIEGLNAAGVTQVDISALP